MDYPELAVGVLIYNNKNEIFLATGEKFDWLSTVPGGHVEIGETLLDCARREVFEETGYNIDNIKFALIQESIFEQDRPNKHFVFINFFARYKKGELKLEISEFTKGGWFLPQQALTLDLNQSTRRLVELFINNFANHES